jgi:hypothetical protein
MLAGSIKQPSASVKNSSRFRSIAGIVFKESYHSCMGEFRVAAGIFLAAIVMACGGAVTCAGAQSADATLDPGAIFAKAREVWDAQSYPARIAYVVTVRVVRNGVLGEKHYAGEYAPASSDLDVSAESDEQLMQGYVPTGVNFRITRRMAGKTVMSLPVNSEAPVDYLGVPLLHPMYSFGLAHAQSTEDDPAPDQPPGAAGPSVIGTVVARTRTYAITLLGEEDYPQGHAYHLALRPLRQPGRFRLRELWIDSARFTTVKAVTEGNFVDGPGTRVDWTITFKTIDGAQYIDTETANAPLKDGAAHYDEASISFQSIQAVHGMPPTRFMFSQLPVRNALTEPKL